MHGDVTVLESYLAHGTLAVLPVLCAATCIEDVLLCVLHEHVAVLQCQQNPSIIIKPHLQKHTEKVLT